MPRSKQIRSRIFRKAGSSSGVGTSGIKTPIAFLRRKSDPAASGLRFAKDTLQSFCRQLWMQHFSGSGAFPLGKIWLSSPKQWCRTCANRRQKLGGLGAESETSEKSSSRVKPMPSNSRVQRSSASRSSIGNCAGVEGGNEYDVGILFSTRLFMVANVNRTWIQLPQRHSSRKATRISQTPEDSGVRNGRPYCLCRSW